ncbi:hypothetical protein [Leifsonia sp. Leaf264]|uniref:hypothetical protein n=1 Tax=Leifsonia sp. Leaf264 TaxID=1736314 RepID=UPI0006F51B7E|nr:hypothetical protein [Leifsonia sp. Leaf264]KQO98271.1 hypothetical protein ASF30_09425 [Leifsonia sp. Leaf264]
MSTSTPDGELLVTFARKSVADHERQVAKKLFARGTAVAVSASVAGVAIIVLSLSGAVFPFNGLLTLILSIVAVVATFFASSGYSDRVDLQRSIRRLAEYELQYPDALGGRRS